MGVRGDAIVQFDWSVGQIMETLDKLGLAENTLIILSSDNGPVVDDGYDDKAEELLNGHSPGEGINTVHSKEVPPFLLSCVGPRRLRKIVSRMS